MLNPEHSPILRRDTHLPAVPPERLLLPTLQAYFAQHAAAQTPATMQPHAQDAPPWLGQRFAEAEKRPAAVLMLIQERDQGDGRQAHILLTKRASHLHKHAGQFAFPGGRCEDQDQGDMVATALRESHEEIALPASSVHVFGCLPEYHSRTGYAITPVVGWLHGNPELVASPDEVADIFWVPLRFLLHPAHHQYQAWQPRQQPSVVQVLSIVWHSPQGKKYYIWGVSADLLRLLYHFLQA